MATAATPLVPGLALPIVLAPMAGGPATVELALAVCEAGGLGFLAAGYRPSEQTREEIRRLRAATDRPFGVNLFVPAGRAIDDLALARYADRLGAEAELYGVQPAPPRYEDDGWAEKLAMLSEERPPVVSFTFGCPDAEELDRLRRAGIAVWVTITDPAQAPPAKLAGADALIVQGIEAGGHRGGTSDPPAAEDFGLLALLRLTAEVCDLPLIAAGGIVDGPGLAAVLCAGARAGQLGTAFMLCPEAGTNAAHRQALQSDSPTALTRAFTGRAGRGIVNRFMLEHGEHAPEAYPHVHHLTSAIRAAARERGDAGGFNLWAGQAHRLASPRPAKDVLERLADDALSALRETEASLAGRLG